MTVRGCVSLCLLGILTLVTQLDLGGQAPTSGHSSHGAAFDRGPREKPWVMDGIGSSHFPITTSDPEVQQWFDQGHTLIHSFWYYEAERAFRWCLKLDPNAAMAYWGLARSYYWRERDIDREAAFMREASKRKDRVSDRERMYIEAWEELYTPEAIAAQRAGGAPAEEVRRRLRGRLEQIIRKYPDDLEAKALFAWEARGLTSRDEIEATLQQVLAKLPEHPGAHHYRIHIWDGREAERSLDSALAYGRTVPAIGHALHMPGHSYSVMGMWHEAAIAMATADRAERDYLRQRLALPFQSWNYAHNRNYLSYLQEQLGMPARALSGARQLLAAPLDPTFNNPDEYGTNWQGKLALVRALVKFERWSELLASATTRHWRPVIRDRMWRTYAETLAHLGLGNLEKAARSAAEHAKLQTEIEKPANRPLDDVYRIQSIELQGRLALARGDTPSAVRTLTDGARRQADVLQQASNNDPPVFPNLLYVVLGRAYVDDKNPALAVEAFEKALDVVRNDGFALAGLVDAYLATGERTKAADVLSRLLYVWSDAESDLPWLRHIKALNLVAAPRDNSPAPQRNYRQVSAQLGAEEWEPYPAPRLDGIDPAGQRVSLETYRGSHVLLMFWLGQTCKPCLQRLVEVNKRVHEFDELGTKLLAISAESPEANTSLQKRGQLPRLLSDVSYANARRFKAYDDFEELPLEATVLIDKKGRVHWARTGGDPFGDIDFLLQEIRRLNGLSDSQPARTGRSGQ